MKMMSFMAKMLPLIMFAKTTVLSGDPVSKAKNAGYFFGGYGLKDLVVKDQIRVMNKKRDMINTFEFRKYSESELEKNISEVERKFENSGERIDIIGNQLSKAFDHSIDNLNLI